MPVLTIFSLRPIWRNEMVRVIKDNLELRNAQQMRTGYIYNDFGEETDWSKKEFNKLHKASCNQIKKMTTTFSKYFFETLDEALEWLENNRDEYSMCRYCLKTFSKGNSSAK